MRGPIFITGATGFVGMELLVRYLERTDRRIFALIRAGDDLQAQQRLRATLATAGVSDPQGRVMAVRGDVTLPRLGLDKRMWDALAEEVEEIVHAAASVSFTLGLAESRAINVEGTRRVLELGAAAARCGGGLRCLSYVSTAYVAGTHRGAFAEDDLDVGQGFRNGYERSKFEAEELVRSHMPGLPTKVFRPSIVVGERDTGWTPAFNVIYWPMRAFARGAYRVLPARPRSPVDVVPVDYVADAVFALASAGGGVGETYALAAGPVASSVGELLALSARAFERRAPRTIPHGLYRAALHPVLVRRADERRRTTLRASEVFFPYFAMRQTFDTTRAADRLAALGIAPSPLDEYFEHLVDYAVAAAWGRQALPRPATRPPALEVAA
jgi:long-chain acyl-CoA synthetase